MDDLGFLALSFAFYEHRSLDGPKRHEYRDEVFGLLEEHYIDDLRLNRLLLSLIRFGGEPGVELVDKVVANSDHRVLRARGAFWSAMERLMEVDDLNSSPAERAEVRAEVTRMAPAGRRRVQRCRGLRGGHGRRGDPACPVCPGESGHRCRAPRGHCAAHRRG